MSGLIALVEPILFILAAPLLAGWTKMVKCRLQNRKAPSLLQPYRELAKLFRKQPVVAEEASWLFEAAPYIVFASAVLAAAVVPFFAVHLPTASIADVIALAGFLALGRFFLVLAGMDVGTAFGGMGPRGKSPSPRSVNPNRTISASTRSPMIPRIVGNTGHLRCATSRSPHPTCTTARSRRSRARSSSTTEAALPTKISIP